MVQFPTLSKITYIEQWPWQKQWLYQVHFLLRTNISRPLLCLHFPILGEMMVESF